MYDLNGNLRTNGSMVLEYDAENQLTNVFVAGIWRTELFYDFAGRLKWRREYSWSGSYWTLVTPITRYIYDGMLVLQERNWGQAAAGKTRRISGGNRRSSHACIRGLFLNASMLSNVSSNFTPI